MDSRQASKLLIVEDNEALRKNLSTFFINQKYKVKTAQNGTEALATMKGYRPQIIFLDIDLPGMSGIELLQQAKAKDPMVRVIMITGEPEDELMKKAKMSGVDDFVVKPFSLEYLSDVVMEKLQSQTVSDYRTTSSVLGIERPKLERLFKAMRDGIIVLNKVGQVIQSNPAAEILLGTSNLPTTKTVDALFKRFTLGGVDEDSDKIIDFSQLLSFDGKHFDLIRTKPKYIVLQCHLSPILDEKELIQGYLLYLENVTKDRDEMTDMNRVVSLVTHKLVTPMTSVMGYLDLLQDNPDYAPLQSEKRKEYIEVATREARRLNQTIQEVLAYSSLGEKNIKLQKMQFGDILPRIHSLLETRQIPLGKIRWDKNLEHCLVFADAELLSFMVSELIENAFKFGARSVDLKVENDDSGDTQISISDDGPGISPEEHDRIFKAFYQIDKDMTGQIPGSGLGLNMVKRIMEAHGGQVSLKSKLGRGSTFTITFKSKEKSLCKR